ncbi:MerR family transcriptional regulator [Ahrensia kielensis]|uniref:MerR family transcriptional regulator n=1 Tax=Ahrensia kielensis TaxID=76980 RepID=UPI00036A5D00|nr:helix-turn-helix domain-containing protein [Ahrensia kielensis]
MFSIGQLSSKVGVKVPTIRYYESIGLIDPPHRSEGNQRRYEPEVLDRLTFIRHARDLGLSIDAIKDLLILNANPDMPCDEAHLIANQHLKDLARKITQLQQLSLELTRITQNCDSDTVGHCKVLEALGDHSTCKSDH